MKSICEHARFEVSSMVNRHVENDILKKIGLVLVSKCSDCGQQFYVIGTAPDLELKEIETNVLESDNRRAI
jgi:hypothetical protein